MALRPRCFRQIGTLAVGPEDDIYNNLRDNLIPTEPAKGRLQSIEDESFPKIDQIKAYLQSIPDPTLDS